MKKSTITLTLCAALLATCTLAFASCIQTDNKTLNGVSYGQGIFTYDHSDGGRYPIAEAEKDTVFYLHVKKALGVLGIKLKRHYIAAGGELFPVGGAEDEEPPRRY